MPGWRNTPRRRLQPLLQFSLEGLLSLQILLEISGHGWRLGHVFWNAIQESANQRIPTSLDFFSCSDRTERALMQHGNAIGDTESAGHFMGDYNDGHVECLLQ